MVPAKGEEGKKLAVIRKGSKVHVTGPLGRHIVRDEYGNISVVTDGLNLGAACWIAQSLRGGENKVYLIAGHKGRLSKPLSKIVEASADKVLLVPDTPSKSGEPIVNEMHNLMRRKHIGLTFTLLNLPLSHKISKLTHLRSKTFSFLMPILDDGLGMCAHCRVVYDGDTRLACIEGPAMDAHKLEWETLLTRHGHTDVNPRFKSDLHLPGGA